MKIIHTNDIPWGPALQHGEYDNKRKDLTGEKLRAGLWELAPGKRSFPLHAHQVTEEALYVLSGRAKVRTPEGETPLAPGDYVIFPAGGTAHQLVNDSSEPFVYLAMSVSQGMDVVDYPESGKVAFALGNPLTGGRRMIFRAKDQASYFDDDE